MFFGIYCICVHAGLKMMLVDVCKLFIVAVCHKNVPYFPSIFLLSTVCALWMQEKGGMTNSLSVTNHKYGCDLYLVV